MFPPVSFRIISHWHLSGTVADAARILSTPEGFPRWWGDVCRGVKTIALGDENGIGQTIAGHSKGWLPYRLNWQGRLVESHMPHGWSIDATGDLVGHGTWALNQNGDQAEITYDWRVTTDRLLFRLLAPLMKGLMIANHNWAMARGEAGLRAELARQP